MAGGDVAEPHDPDHHLDHSVPSDHSHLERRHGFSAAILVDLRIWRLLERDEPLPDVARRFLPTIWPVLLILLVTGSLLIIGEPRRSLVNSTFYVKMALLAVAIMLTAGLQRSILSSPDLWDGNRARRIAGRFAAAVSILVWCGILFAGRWIAYTQAG